MESNNMKSMIQHVEVGTRLYVIGYVALLQQQLV